MVALFRKKSFVDRIGEALGRKPRRSGGTAVRSGLIALGSAAGLTALSAVVSAVRDRQDQESAEGQDDRS